MSGALVRAGARNGEITGQTSALAPSYLQANLIVLPSCYADDFEQLCKRNPVPCPLIAKSASIGSYNTLDSWIEGVAGEDLAADVDIRIDIPKYMVYENGELLHDHVDDIKAHWTEDHVAFLIGCSYSFEGALIDGGLMPQHIRQRRNVPMYKTNIMLCPAGVLIRVHMWYLCDPIRRMISRKLGT
ncbi:17b9ec35-572f-4a70-abf4-d140b1f28733 [Sclerotinia trifoliorum]|uniref:17b9ec35-572f-4a70-abf4-d140b1f28733 n=1 Tax=Sclerotinia trifoliorum TaxID=28548 RepID=A0A8H2VTX6_9HELO|nr:17b9ec35-572f-4a70-abf4-d140b1f28733 [Sclerotinia trifoliorum]